jgi:c-di-AMP phosphodiesterase-like protein
MQYLVSQSDILRNEAEALLSGIVMDTKNFTMRTGSRTFDAAAYLRRAGADTTEVKRLLQNDFGSTVAKYRIIQSAKMYGDGIAIAVPGTAEDRVIAAQAADELLNVSGVNASFVIYPEGEVVNISARSMSDINVQVVLEKLGGGGNRSTAGAQIRDMDYEEVLEELLKAIDSYLKAPDVPKEL